MGGIDNIFEKTRSNEAIIMSMLNDIKNDISLPLSSLRDKLWEIKKSSEYKNLEYCRPDITSRIDKEHMQPLFVRSRIDFSGYGMNFPRPYSVANLSRSTHQP